MGFKSKSNYLGNLIDPVVNTLIIFIIGALLQVRNNKNAFQITTFNPFNALTVCVHVVVYKTDIYILYNSFN